MSFKVDVFGPKFRPFDQCLQEVITEGHPFVLVSECPQGSRARLEFIQSVFERLATLADARPIWLKEDGSLKKVEYLNTLQEGPEKAKMEQVWDRAVGDDGFIKIEDLHTFSEDSARGLFNIEDVYLPKHDVKIGGEEYELLRSKCTCVATHSMGYAVEIPAITQKIALYEEGTEEEEGTYGELTLDMIKCLDSKTAFLVNSVTDEEGVGEAQLIDGVDFDDVEGGDVVEARPAPRAAGARGFARVAQVCNMLFRNYVVPCWNYTRAKATALYVSIQTNIVQPVIVRCRRVYHHIFG